MLPETACVCSSVNVYVAPSEQGKGGTHPLDKAGRVSCLHVTAEAAELCEHLHVRHVAALLQVLAYDGLRGPINVCAQVFAQS